MNLLVQMTGPEALPVASGQDYDVKLIHWPTMSANERWRRKFAASWWAIDLHPTLEEYECVAFLDDDVQPSDGVTWSDIFRLFRETGARVGAPALSAKSYYAHDITRQASGSRWRETNYMDLMAVLFSADALEHYWSMFDCPGDQWGLEQVWSRKEEEAGRSLVILDATPVDHLRPIGKGRDVALQMKLCAELLERNNVKPIYEHKTLRVHA